MQRVDLAILFALKEEFNAFFPRIPKGPRIEKDQRTGRSCFSSIGRRAIPPLTDV